MSDIRTVPIVRSSAPAAPARRPNQRKIRKTSRYLIKNISRVFFPPFLQLCYDGERSSPHISRFSCISNALESYSRSFAPPNLATTADEAIKSELRIAKNTCIGIFRRILLRIELLFSFRGKLNGGICRRWRIFNKQSSAIKPVNGGARNNVIVYCSFADRHCRHKIDHICSFDARSTDFKCFRPSITVQKSIFGVSLWRPTSEGLCRSRRSGHSVWDGT